MAIARVQKIPTSTTSAYSGASSSLSVTFGSATTSGNALVCGGGLYDSSGGAGTSLAFSDNQTPGHSWTKATDGADGNIRGCIAYVLSITGKASHQLTITPSQTADLQMGAVELSGVGAFEDKSEAAATSTGAVTSSAGDYCFARADASNNVGAITWSGSTLLHAQNDGWDSQSEKIVSSGGSENPSWASFYNDTYCGIARFSAAGAAVLPPGLAGLRGHRRRAQVMRRR